MIKKQSGAAFTCLLVLKILRVFGSLYLFFGLDLMGLFSPLGSTGNKGAGNLFKFSQNHIDHIVCLMVGILATVLIQSFSTSISIVVGLMGANVWSVRNAIPIIMDNRTGKGVWVCGTFGTLDHCAWQCRLQPGSSPSPKLFGNFAPDLGGTLRVLIVNRFKLGDFWSNISSGLS